MTPADEKPAAESPEDERRVRIRLVGPLRVYVDGRRVADPPAGRAASLLAMLAVDADHVVPLDRIIDDLWPAGSPAKAEQNVASLVSRLRRVVGRRRIEGGRSGYRLVRSGGLETDLLEAQAAVAEAESQLASGAYNGACGAARRALAVLDGGDVVEDDPYAAWAETPRRRAEALRRRARAGLWTASLAAGDTRSALDAATAAVDSDPFDEEAHRVIMRASHRRGDRGAALLAYKRLERSLHDELGVAPSPETAGLYEAIVAGAREPLDRPGDPGDLGGATSATGLAPLVGRELQLAQLRDA